MANEKHIYVTFTGGYIAAATALANEIWQFGIRFPLVFGTVDPIGTLPSNWEPYAVAINRTEAEWNISGNWSVQGPMTKTFSVDDWLNDQVGPAAKAFIKTTALFSQSVELREINAYPIGTTGHAVPAPPYAAGSPIKLTFTTKPLGAASGSMPLQVTPVVSLLTQQVGRRGKGRIYCPILTGTAVGSSANAGILASGTQNFLVAAAKAFLEDSSYAGVAAGDPRIQPGVIGAPWTNYATVQAVRVDNVLDTQQRRRRQVISTRAQDVIEVG